MYKFIMLCCSIILFGCQAPKDAKVQSNSSLNKQDTAWQSLTNEQKFFKCIFQRYPNNYYKLGSEITFSETYDTLSKEYTHKFGFVVIDSNFNDEKKYLTEITDSIINKYIPTLHFYQGTHGCHYELSADGLDFIGFLNNSTSDFVMDTTGIHNDLKKVIIGTCIHGVKEKQKFANSLLRIMSPALLFRPKQFKESSSSLKWKNDQVIVTNTYKSNTANTSISLIITFSKDSIMNLSINANE